MSTKSTIAHGDDFHIYEDVTDVEPEPIHIELDSVRECDVHHRVYNGEARIAVDLVIDRALWQRILQRLKETK